MQGLGIGAGMRCVCAVGLILLAGCKPQIITRTETVEVPVYVRQPVDRVLTEPSVCAYPQPACHLNGERRYCNGQLVEIIRCQQDALGRANADKAAIRNGGE